MTNVAPPPLTGLKVVELAGLAPAPFCGLLLSSYGASVLRIDRPSPTPSRDFLTTYKSSIPLDLKQPSSLRLLKKLLSKADILIDPFRPGILEKIGLSPHDVLLKLNPSLIIVRLTGFRKDGKYKDMAGHDINYLAASGVLSLLGEREKPPLPPGNLLADFAGGGLVAFTGVLLALIQRGLNGSSKQGGSGGGGGQVIDANMVDGVNFLGTFPRQLLNHPMWGGERGTNPLDGGSPFYGCYECKDERRYMSVGALEPQFFKELLKGLGLKMEDVLPKGDEEVKHREDPRSWEHMRKVFEKRFRTKTRMEWEEVFDGTDACCVPVLTMQELQEQKYDLRPIVGLEQSPGKIKQEWDGLPLEPGAGGEKVLKEWLGWTRGKDFELDTEKGWFVIEKSKL